MVVVVGQGQHHDVWQTKTRYNIYFSLFFIECVMLKYLTYCQTMVQCVDGLYSDFTI